MATAVLVGGGAKKPTKLPWTLLNDWPGPKLLKMGTVSALAVPPETIAAKAARPGRRSALRIRDLILFVSFSNVVEPFGNACCRRSPTQMAGWSTHILRAASQRS